MATKKCPVCEVSVKLENLERHVRNQHPRADVDLASLLSEEERAETTRTTRATPALTRRGTQIVAIVALVVAAILILVIFNPFPNVGPGPGQTAPDFSVRTTTGSTIVLSSYRGTPVLLEFMDVDCPACAGEVPTLVSLFANYSSSVRFLSIDVNFVGSADDDAKIGSWASARGATWPYALDRSSITRAYGVTATPTTYVLDSSGVVRAKLLPPNNSYADFVAALSAAGA